MATLSTNVSTTPSNTSLVDDAFFNPFSGRHFRIFLYLLTPNVMPVSGPNYKEIRYPLTMPIDSIQGILVDFLRIMAADLNFTYDIYFPKDGQFGSVNKNGTWNGIIKHLMDGDGDMALGLSTNSDRSKAVDLSPPILYASRGFMLKKGASNVDYFRFVKPLALKLWMALLVTLVVMAFVVSLINRLSPYDFHGNFIYCTQKSKENLKQMKRWRRLSYLHYKHKSLSQLSWRNSTWSNFAVLCQQGSTYPESPSNRFTFWGWWILIIVLTTSYTASMTAWLTQERLQKDIETVADLLNAPGYRYGAISNTGTFTALSNYPMTIFKTLVKNMVMNNWLVDSEAKGVEKVREGKYALFLGTATILAYTGQPPCDLRLAKDTFDTSRYAAGMPKGRSETKALSMYILRAVESGIIDQIENKWLVDNCTGNNDLIDGRLSASEVTGIFIVIYGAMGLSLLVLILERCIWSIKKYLKRKKYIVV